MNSFACLVKPVLLFHWTLKMSESVYPVILAVQEAEGLFDRVERCVSQCHATIYILDGKHIINYF
jgi:hypothetical protein